MTILTALTDCKLANTIREGRTQIISELLLIITGIVFKRAPPPKIIAITGSVGKTTTKGCLAHMLGETRSVHATPYNANDRLGVPRTLLDLPNIYNFRTLLAATPRILRRLLYGLKGYEFIVLEMGARLPNTLPRQLRFFRPSMSVITSIAPAHLETLGSLEGVFQEKSSLVSALSGDGHAILCFDDPMVRKMGGLSSAPSIFYGFSPSADVWMDAPVRAANGMSTTLHDANGSIDLHFPYISNRHHLYAVMAAWCVGRIVNLPRAAMATAVQSFEPSFGRGKILRGPDDCLIYDDSYNANPLSMHSALETFDSIAGQRRRIIVLGDMLELGTESEHWHKEIGNIAGNAGEVLFAIGVYAKHYSSAFQSRSAVNRAFEFTSPEAAYSKLKREMSHGDAILLRKR